MSRRNGDKARWGVDRKRRITQRAKDRARRAAAALQKPVVKVAKPAPAPKAVEPPPAAAPEQPVKKPRARKPAAPPAE